MRLTKTRLSNNTSNVAISPKIVGPKFGPFWFLCSNSTTVIFRTMRRKTPYFRQNASEKSMFDFDLQPLIYPAR